MLSKIPEAATRDHCHATNARPCTIQDYAAILEASMG
jgi:alcohol dehydrogenase class IV